MGYNPTYIAPSAQKQPLLLAAVAFSGFDFIADRGFTVCPPYPTNSSLGFCGQGAGFRGRRSGFCGSGSGQRGRRVDFAGATQTWRERSGILRERQRQRRPAAVQPSLRPGLGGHFGLVRITNVFPLDTVPPIRSVTASCDLGTTIVGHPPAPQVTAA